MNNQFLGPAAPHLEPDPRPASPVTAEVAIYLSIIAAALTLIWMVA